MKISKCAIWVMFCLAVVSLGGCDVFTTNGEEGQPCFTDSDTCKPGLVCVDGKCVKGVGDGGVDGGVDGGDGCTAHDDCGPNDICVNSGCKAAYGGEFRFTVQTAGISQYDPNGGAWDAPGGIPDPIICFYLNQSSVPIGVAGAEFCTSIEDDTYTPEYNEGFRDNIFASDSWMFVAFDDDLTDYEYIEHHEYDSITMDLLKGGGFVFEGNYLVKLVVSIDPVE